VTIPEPIVRVTQYAVGILPETNINAPFYEITVDYRGHDRWAVTRHRQCLSLDGEWEWESIPSERTDEWLETHRFDEDTALRLAREQAPHAVVNGRSALDVLRALRDCTTCEHHLPAMPAEEQCNPDGCGCTGYAEACDVHANPPGATFPIANCPSWQAARE